MERNRTSPPASFRFGRMIISLAAALAVTTTAYAKSVHFPLIQALTYFPYTDNSTLNKNQFSLHLACYYSNVYRFSYSGATINDFETMGIQVGARYGITDRDTLEIYLHDTAVFGGFLDKFIEDFHKAFSLPPNGRTLFPRNAVHYKFQDRFFYETNQNAVLPLVVGLSKNLYQSSSFSINSRVAAGIPLSHKPGFSSDKPFLTLGIAAAYTIKRSSLNYDGYISWMKSPLWLEGVPLHSYVLFSRVEACFHPLLIGFIIRSSPFKEGDVAHTAYQVYVGCKISRRLDLVILEDFAPYDTTPDISLFLRLKLL